MTEDINIPSRNSGEMIIIRSRLLKRNPHLRFGMSTRVGGTSPEPFGLNLSFHVGDDDACVRVNRARFLERMGTSDENLASPGQVHGAAVRRVSSPGRYAETDALITDRPGLFLAVSVADCVPICLFDPVTGSVAAVHTGWRGSRLRILSRAIESMRGSLGVRSADLLAYIGPAAHACCYEVGEEVASQFDEAFIDRSEGRKPHLDMVNLNRAILLEAGVNEEQIETSDYCTICHPELFHSYRRDGRKSGRMMALIGRIS